MVNKYIILTLSVFFIFSSSSLSAVSENDCFTNEPETIELNVDGSLLRFLHGKVYDSIYKQKISLPDMPCDENLCYHGASKSVNVKPPPLPLLPIIHIDKLCMDSGFNVNGKNLLITAKIGDIVFSHPLINSKTMDQMFTEDDINISIKTDDSFQYRGLNIPYLEISVPIRGKSIIYYEDRMGLDAIITGWGCREWHCSGCKYDIPDLNVTLEAEIKITPPKITYRIQPIIIDNKFYGFNPEDFLILPKVTVNAEITRLNFANGFWDFIFGTIAGLDNRIKNQINDELRRAAKRQGQKIANEIISKMENQINNIVEKAVIAVGDIVKGKGLDNINFINKWSFIEEKDVLDQFYLSSLITVEKNLTDEEGLIFSLPSPLLVKIINRFISELLLYGNDPLKSLSDGSFIQSIKNQISLQYNICPIPVGMTRDWEVYY